MVTGHVVFVVTRVVDWKLACWFCKKQKTETSSSCSDHIDICLAPEKILDLQHAIYMIVSPFDFPT
jgi:hypothetical protein